MMKTLTTYLCTMFLLEKSKKLGENKNVSNFFRLKLQISDDKL